MQKSRLEQNQQLQLQQRINPRQVALGRVLEMTAPEFEEEVRRELAENPALETVEEYAPGSADFDETADQLQRADFGDDDDIPLYLHSGVPFGSESKGAEAGSFTADDSESMYEMLMARLRDDFELTDAQMHAASYIIGSLDSNGYLTRTPQALKADMAVFDGVEPSDADMAKAYETVRLLDPPGIGATDLRDCLLLQLDRRRQSEAVDDARTMLTSHFDDFSHRRFDRLMAAMGLGRERLNAALDLIRSLNPKPGSAFESAASEVRMRHITPDFVLDYDRDSDRFNLTVVDNIPELAIAESFKADLAPETDSRRDALTQAQEYIKVRRDSAAAFIELARQRVSTLSAIARAIVHIQRRFFISGDRADLRPMVLRDVSAATGLSLSTISRAISAKYMQTQSGIVAMKSLFNEGAGDSSELASPAILQALAEVVDNEDKRRPLSDARITELLAERGFNLARRTVAKYRERAGIPIAQLRKQI